MIAPIRNEADLERALVRMEELWDAAAGTAQADELEVLSILVERYEATAHALPDGEPRELLRYVLEQKGISQNQLAKRAGLSSGRVSELLSGKRELTLSTARALAEALGLSMGALWGQRGATGQGAGWIQVDAELYGAVCERYGAGLVREALEGKLQRLAEAPPAVARPVLVCVAA